MASQTDDDKLSRLRAMACDDGGTWDLSVSDQEAIRFALHRISELEADENQVVGNLVATDVTDGDSEDGADLESDVLYQVIAIAPKRVTCAHCGATFETEIASEDQE